MIMIFTFPECFSCIGCLSFCIQATSMNEIIYRFQLWVTQFRITMMMKVLFASLLHRAMLHIVTSDEMFTRRTKNFPCWHRRLPESALLCNERSRNSMNPDNDAGHPLHPEWSEQISRWPPFLWLEFLCQIGILTFSLERMERQEIRDDDNESHAHPVAKLETIPN